MFANTHGKKDCSLLVSEVGLQKFREMSLYEMLACSRALCFYKSQNTQPEKKKENPTEYKVEQKWDSSFGVVGKSEDMWDFIYPE